MANRGGVKKACKKLALKYHPDRRGGSKQDFNALGACYKKHMEDEKADESWADTKRRQMEVSQRMEALLKRMQSDQEKEEASRKQRYQELVSSQEASRKQRYQELELEKQKMQIQQQQFEEQHKIQQQQFEEQQKLMQKQFDMQQQQMQMRLKAQQQQMQEEKKQLQDQIAKDMERRWLQDKVEALMGQHTMKELKTHLSPLNIQNINPQKTKAGLKLVLLAHAKILIDNNYLY